MILFFVTHFSSNANNGANAGGFYWNLNNDSSNRNRNIGTQLAISKWSCVAPASNGEYVYPIQFGNASEQLGE